MTTLGQSVSIADRSNPQLPPHKSREITGNQGVLQPTAVAVIEDTKILQQSQKTSRSNCRLPASRRPTQIMDCLYHPSNTRSPSFRSRSGSPPPEPSINPNLSIDAGCMSVRRQEASLPQAPPYEKSTGDEWLKGSYNIERTIMLVYNLHPTGGV